MLTPKEQEFMANHKIKIYGHILKRQREQTPNVPCKLSGFFYQCWPNECPCDVCPGKLHPDDPQIEVWDRERMR